MKTNFERHVLLALILSLVSSAVLADGYAPAMTGSPPLSTITGGPFDTVNLANLDVHFSIPIFSRPGAGMQFNYNLSYDSLVWGIETSSGAKSWQPASNSDFGWQDFAQAITGDVAYTTLTTTYSCSNHKITYTFGGFEYQDAQGTVHAFAGNVVEVVVNGGSGCGSSSTTPLTNSPALDNSGYILTTNGTTATVNARGGLTYSVGVVGEGVSGGSVKDANGNTIQVAANNRDTQVTDTLNSMALDICCQPVHGNPAVINYTFTAPNGQGAAIVVKYVEYQVQTNFQIPGIKDFSPAQTYHLVDTITLPDGTYYHFTYEATDGYPGSTTGRIASVRLPTGGTITYSYGSTDSMMADGSPVSMIRTVGGGQWSYARGYQNGPSHPLQTTMVVVDPANNETDLNFSGGYETMRTAYKGRQSAVLDYSYTCYNGNYQDNTCPTAVVNAQNGITWTSHNDHLNTISFTNMYSGIQHFYDTYGNVTQEDDYDFGSPQTGHQLLRVKNMTYDTQLCNSLNRCNLPLSVQTTDSASNQKALTSYTYDTKGNATQIARWIASGVAPLTTSYTYNSNGTVSTVTDPNRTRITYTYASGSSCNSAFPTSMSVPGDWGTVLNTSYTYNCTGGVVTSVTDPNGATTTTSYTYPHSDPHFWRPSSTTDALGNTTYYNYYSVMNFSGGSTMGVGQTESGMIWNSGHSTSDTVATLDNLGRLSLKQTRQAPGSGNFDTVETDYDNLSNISQQSQPFSCSLGHGLASCSGAVTTITHDGLHRPLLVTGPAGETTAYTYNLNDVETTKGPTQFFSKELQYDALGRFTSTCEMSSSLSGVGACGQNTPQTGYLTSYQYDPLGNLTAATQGAQNRSFSYDGVSRILSEANPENGTTHYTYDTDATCGASTGDKVKRMDAAGNTSCYGWDGLHRLTQMTYPSGPNSGYTQGKYYNYDNPATSDGVTSTYSLGRLVSTYACCLQSDGWGVFEVYAYDKRGGATDFYEGAYYGGATFHTVDQLGANGAVAARMGYVGATGTDAFTNKLVYSFDGEGRPIGLTDQTTGDAIWNPAYTTYNPADEPNQLVFYPSGDSEQFTWDPHPGHMRTWQSNVGARSQYGNLTWHINGTLAQLQIQDGAYPSNNQTCSYGYDDLARLSSVNCGASIWKQNFSYDRYGNIAKSVPQGSQGASFPATYNTANNHVSNLGFSYDADGNVLVDNAFNIFIYDSEGRQSNVNAFATYFDAFDREVTIQNPDAYYEVVYAPDGYKMAIMNGTSVVTYSAPLAAGVQAVYTANSPARIDHWRHADWQGSSRIASTRAQQVYYDGSYAPFGENYNETGYERSYTGQTQDTSSGIYDFPYRQQSSNQGRWFVPDPSGLTAVDITNPQSLNRYAYIGNNPISNVDPLGLYDDDDGDDLDWGGGDGWYGGDDWNGDDDNGNDGDNGCSADFCVTVTAPADDCQYSACVTDTLPPDVPTEDVPLPPSIPDDSGDDGLLPGSVYLDDPWPKDQPATAPTCFFYFGNYGGPCYTGGQWMPLEDMTPEQQANLPPPVDVEDTCYQSHDYCYYKSRVAAGTTHGSSPSQAQTNAENFMTGQCDLVVAACLSNVPNLSTAGMAAEEWFVLQGTFKVFSYSPLNSIP